MKQMPLNLGYDPACKRCEQGMRNEAGHLGNVFRVFCDCVTPMPAESNTCVECGHDREEHRSSLMPLGACMMCLCQSFVPVAS